MERLLSKKMRSQQWLQQSANSCLSCIHCQQPLVVNERGVACANGHQFDLNKQGTLFMATKSVDEHYDQMLFQARRRFILTSRYYDALTAAMVEELQSVIPAFSGKSFVVVDAGAGEGSHLERIAAQLPENIVGVSLDLAKEGIRLASDYAGKQLAIVADLANMPLQSEQVGAVLSILSPSNYDEFKRLLHPKGVVLKVIPNENYLREIRQALVTLGYAQTDTYDNDATQRVFAKHYPNYRVRVIQAKATLKEDDKANLVAMTPLTWHLDAKQRAQLIALLPDVFQLDVSLLISR